MTLAPRVLVTRPIPRSAREYAQARFDTLFSERNMRDTEVVQVCRDQQVAGLLMGGNLKLPAPILAALPDSVRVIATTSIGTDHIDLAAAARRGITVTNVPDIGPDCAADIAFMHILMVCRRALDYDRLMRDGWGRKLGFDEMLGHRVHHRRIGIVGWGRIGQLMARRALGFDMEVHCTDVRVPDTLPSGVVFHADIDALLPHADILTLHVPDLPETRGLLDARRLARLPRGAFVINAARGTLVDQEALIEALHSGQLAGAGLDTFPDEPQVDARLRAMPQVTLTPHAGSATVETREGICLRCLDNIDAVLQGRRARGVVTAPPVPATTTGPLQS